MSKMKKVLLMGIAYALVAALAIGGTIAYLTSGDSDINVMTLGNVSIEQHEYERVVDENGNYTIIDVDGVQSYELKDFTQNKPLFPFVGEVEGGYDPTEVRLAQLGHNSRGGMNVFRADNVQDKFVVVENTGKTDAYVRTIVALEAGNLGYDDWWDVIGYSFHFTWEENYLDAFVEIDGNNYIILELTYKGYQDIQHPNGVLTPGDYTYNSLAQIYMFDTATNEDVEAVDGNKNGTYDILVLSQAVQTAGFADAKAALDAGFGTTAEKAAEWFGGVLKEHSADTWDGTVDTSWYNDTDTEFSLTSAEQLAGLAKLVDDGNTFAGKTITLTKNIDLYALDENGNRVLFEPIGDASNADFSGIFDGNNKTIFNLRQDCNSKHVALFGAVYEGTVKNLVLDGALIENNGSGYAGGIAAYAGASNFENITLKNTTVVNYNHNTGGIVAWCSNNGTTTTFDGINIEDTTTIGSWWGSYDTRVGGVVGAMNTGNYVVIKNSKIACKLDVYNDATSNYQWYNYRTCGMVVADVRDNHTVNDRTEANPARVICENVEVIFGDWANYHYCEDASYGTPSYADAGEYKFRRVEAGLGYGGIDLSACDHDADETHNQLIAFDFLFGARDGKGIYGISSFNGVTVIKD